MDVGHSRVLTEAEAAAYTGLSVSTLRQGRARGHRACLMETPPFIKFGRRVGYRLSDLNDYVQRHRSTAL